MKKVDLNNYKSIREVVFESIRQSIISGEFKPGQRLMEIQLADSMGVSRTPVREAIRKLELEGLVIMLPRKGAQVASLTIRDIMNVLEVRGCLDSLATELAAERMSEDDIKNLKNIYSQFVSFVEKGNTQGAIKKDTEFHEIIYKASKNEKLLQILNNLREQVHRFRVIYIKDLRHSQDLIREHSDILDAIEKRNVEKAKIYAEKHIKNQALGIIKSVEEESDV